MTASRPACSRIGIASWLAAFLMLTATWAPSVADESASADVDTFKSQRQDFLAAEKALRNGRRGEYRRLLTKLQGYPLLPYLHFAELRGRLKRARASEVQSFLTQYADTSLAPRLRRRWLTLLGKRANWDQYLADYQPLGDTKTDCLAAKALLARNRETEAFRDMETLWLSARSQPKECDPVFEAWRGQGHMTATLVWERFRLAINAGQGGLARYLVRFLPDADKKWARLWQQVRRNPALIRSTKLFRDEHPVVNEILLYGLKRYARRDPRRAAAAWDQMQKRRKYAEAETFEAYRALGMGYALKHRLEGLLWLKKIPAVSADLDSQRWRIRAALREAEWGEVLVGIDALPLEEKLEGRWQYWRARALLKLGRAPEANTLLGQLAATRSYFGFLAADRLGLGYNLTQERLVIAPEEIQRLQAIPALARARELLRLKRLHGARLEWAHGLRAMNDEEVAQAARLAEHWGWPGRAILTLGRTPYRSDLILRFPLAYRELITHQARHQRLDLPWVYAIVRQESAFQPDARSKSGALGLMQIMPRTGREIAGKLNKKLRNKHQLLDTDLNVRFGSSYLRTLLDTLGNHPILATAAYNAGPNAVKKWLPKDKEMPADRWIESVPYTQTREYLRRVFAYTAIYENRLQTGPTPLSGRLTAIPSKKTISAAVAQR